MIAVAVDDPGALLARMWAELRDDPRVADLVALVPSDRRLGIAEGMALLPSVLVALGGPQRQVECIDAAVRAYLRAAGLHITED
jgi:hypothetical protein